MSKLVTKNGAEVVLIPKVASNAVRKFNGQEINERTHCVALIDGQLGVVNRSNLKEVK